MPIGAFRRSLLAMMAATFAIFTGAVSPASADQGDKQGWSLGSDPRKRVFLRFVPANDGPRVLVLGCLRDVDSFTVLSEQGVIMVWSNRQIATRVVELLSIQPRILEVDFGSGVGMLAERHRYSLTAPRQFDILQSGPG